MDLLAVAHLHKMNGKKSESKHRSLLRPFLLIFLISTIFIIAYIFGFGEHLSDLQPWIQSWGIWAPVVYLLIYLGIVLISLPATPFGIIAGIIFGSTIGIILIIIGATLGSAFTFLIARYFARDSVSRWVKDNPRFQRLDQLIETHGTIIVIVTRLVPLFPFNILNYGFGLTKIPFKTYMLWSTIGMIPGTIVFVGGSDAIYQSLTTGSIPLELTILIVSMILLMMGIGWYVKSIYTKANNYNNK
jgi:uncharacterized membrane protein YdjX (TVP38/TMEM64 family)